MEILLPTLPHAYWDGLMNSPKAWSIDTLPFGECYRMMPDSCLEQWWGQLLCVSLHTQRIWSTISGAMRHSQQDLFKVSPREPQGKVRIFQQWECYVAGNAMGGYNVHWFHHRNCDGSGGKAPESLKSILASPVKCQRCASSIAESMKQLTLITCHVLSLPAPTFNPSLTG